MRPLLACCLAALALTGCEAMQLQHRTVRQSGTLAELHQQEVLDNLAVTAARPCALPSFALADKGTTTIYQTGELDGGVNWDYTFLGTMGKFLNHLDKKNLAFRASQQDTDQWNTDAVLNPDKLWLMRCAFLKVVGAPCIDADCDAKLASFFKPEPQLLASIHPGWLCIGRKHDIPHDACGAAHCGDAYVWVAPGGGEDFARFCLAILDIATAADSGFGDATAGQITKLEGRVNTLSQVFKNLPEDTPEQRASKTRLALQIEIDVAKLEAIYNELPPEQKKTLFTSRLDAIVGKKAYAATGVLDNPDAFKTTQENEFNALLEASQSAPVLRARKDFNSYPIYPNIVPISP